MNDNWRDRLESAERAMDPNIGRGVAFHLRDAMSLLPLCIADIVTGEEEDMRRAEHAMAELEARGPVRYSAALVLVDCRACRHVYRVRSY